MFGLLRVILKRGKNGFWKGGGGGGGWDGHLVQGCF